MRLAIALRIVVGLGGIALLSGCVLPPAVAALSYAADAGSFLATGKSATDHGVSYVMQEDCALLRVFDGAICRPEERYELAEGGVLQPLPDDNAGSSAVIDEILARLNAPPTAPAGQDGRAGALLAELPSGGVPYLADGVVAGGS